MKQKITIKAFTPNDSTSFRLLSCWQVNNEILVLLENNSESCGGEVCCEIEENFEVDTAANSELPIKIYIVHDRYNRGVFSSDISRFGTDDDMPLHFLFSAHDFYKLVVDGKLLAKGVIDVFDLRTLLREEKDLDAQIKTMDLYKQTEVIVTRLLEQNPSSYEIYCMMLKAGLFNGDLSYNINLIGHLVDGMQKLSEENQEKMAKLYLFLAGGKQCFLTGYIHDVLNDAMFYQYDLTHGALDGSLQFMQDMQPLSAKIINTIFLFPFNYIHIHKFISRFDKTFACERYLYETVDNPEEISSLAHEIKCEGLDHGGDIDKIYPWMTVELFKKLIDAAKVNPQSQLTFRNNTLPLSATNLFAPPPPSTSADQQVIANSPSLHYKK